MAMNHNQIGITHKNFLDYYDQHITSIAQTSLTRSTYSNILSRPNLLSFLQLKLKLKPVSHYRLTEESLDKTIESGRTQPFIAYYDEEVHNGAGKRLFHAQELVESPQQALMLKQLAGTFICEFVPTTADSLSQSISTTYFKIGDLTYWVEYRGDGWSSSYATNFTTRILSQAELEANWSAQVATIAAAEPILGKIPMLSIDFLKDINTGEIFASDFNLSPRIGETAIAQVLSSADCWAQISGYTATHLDRIYDYLLIAHELPSHVLADGFVLKDLVQLRYIPSGSFWLCLEDNTLWKYLHGETDASRYFWRQKTSSGQAIANQLDRKHIFKGRSYRRV
jgi:hypothetical protein